MRFRFVLDGARYSKRKGEFKKLLKEHGLRWRGTRMEFVWQGPRERVVAEYERDVTRDITVRAVLVWEGKSKTPFLNELKTWAFSLGAKSAEEKRPREDPKAAKARVERELAFWDALHKPDEDALRAAGRPDDWIERDLARWKKARDAKRKELLRA